LSFFLTFLWVAGRLLFAGEHTCRAFQGLSLLLRVQVFTCSCTHAFMYSWIHVFMCSCVHVFMCSCVPVFMCSWMRQCPTDSSIPCRPQAQFTERTQVVFARRMMSCKCTKACLLSRAISTRSTTGTLARKPSTPSSAAHSATDTGRPAQSDVWL
jgi:hypothetical protein